MRKFHRVLPALAIGLSLVAAVALADTSQPQPQGVPNFGAGYGGNGVVPPSIKPAGILYGTTANVATGTGTSEQTLGTYSLPGYTLDQVGRRLRIRAMFVHAANTNSITPKLYFGSESIAGPANTTSGAGVVLELNVTKTGSNTQRVWGWGANGATAPVNPTYQAGAETDTSAITIKATCTDGSSSAADCTLAGFSIEYLN